MQKIKRTLVVDDDPFICNLLKQVLTIEGYEVTTVQTGQKAIQCLGEDLFPVIILDIMMDDMDGLEVLQAVRAQQPHTKVIMLTAHASIENSVEALRLGAFDYLLKGPQVQDEIIPRVERAFETIDLQWQNTRLQEQIRLQHRDHGVKDFVGMIGSSKAMRQVYQVIQQIAASDATVLIQGETGTGKELVAHAIHELSLRKDNSLVVVDCNIPENIAEAEMFGVVKDYPGFHRKEALTGLFELADEGTLFFDELGDLPLSTQAKILRTLQERKARPLGADRAVPIDFRVIGATNRNLEEAIEQQQFREDLYYRFNVVTIHIPPLRDRKEDIPYLVEHFLGRAEKKMTLQHSNLKLSPDALQVLLDYDFPGNVRELENIIDRTALLATTDVIPQELIMINSSRSASSNGVTLPGLDWTEKTLAEARNDMEEMYLRRLLERTGGNISQAARQAGIDRKNFRQKLSRYGIDVDTFKAAS